MNRRLLLSAIGLSPLALISAKIPTLAQDSIVETLIKRWKKSKAYTLTVFDTMPANDIEFSPSVQQLSFAQHFIHLGFINVTYIGVLVDTQTYADFYALMEADFVMQPPDGINVFQPDRLKERDAQENKARVAQYISDTFDYVITQLGNLHDAMLTQGENKEKPDYLSGHNNLDLILRGESHTAHHRAQAIAYLRANGVQPPGYTVNNKF
ncbi:DinB family protein [Flagellimonas allohymeniacidonis]|uniref:DinB family protein n=1 Tax=Flagellimonas allohymeniacidonis TaxID=2517819 RepID=A0A4V2HSS7_9FLAO|nr:DinB family protein [Allomuricauda hymeniacidonis]TAI48880.1 DinB family protein [Allomuricauda hymeniacidonis]